MSRPAISVLMPVRDGARHLDAALASLAAQSFADFEIVAVDNGSRDATPEILAGWAQRDPRIRVARLESNRLAASLNKAASLARAPILARLDADDLAHLERFARQAEALAARPEVGLIGSGALLIDESGRLLGEVHPPLGDRDIRRRQESSCGIIPSSAMFRADVFHAAGGFREGLNISEDFDLWMRMSDRCRLANLREALVSYRIHGDSITARRPVRMALASLCVTAGAEARRQGAEEPFADGRPKLRAALPLLGLTRRDARRLVQARAFGNLVSRRLLGLPLPPFLRALSPRLARGLRLRAIYQVWLRSRLGRV